MSRGQVYVVDDDLFIRQSTCDLVESVGLQGKAYGSAEAFLDAYSEEVPTVVVVDVRLPGTGGLQIQESLAARTATAPVIFVTGYGDAWTAVQAMKAGAFDFLEKPIKEQELLNAVQAAIRFHEQIIQEKSLQGAYYQVARLTPREVDFLLRARVKAKENPVVINEIPSGGEQEPVATGLTARQCQILMALRNGASNKEIGRTMGIRESTVKMQLKAIYRVLGVNNRTQAALVAHTYDQGRFSVPPIMDS